MVRARFFCSCTSLVDRFTRFQEIACRSRSYCPKDPEQEKGNRVSTEATDVIVCKGDTGIKCCGKKNGCNPGRDKGWPEDCNHSLYQGYRIHGHDTTLRIYLCIAPFFWSDLLI